MNSNALRKKCSVQEIVEIAKAAGVQGMEWGLGPIDGALEEAKTMLKATQDEYHNREDDEEPRLRLAVVIHRQIHHRTAAHRQHKQAQRVIRQLCSHNALHILCDGQTRERKEFSHQERADKVTRQRRCHLRPAILAEVAHTTRIERKALTHNSQESKGEEHRAYNSVLAHKKYHAAEANHNARHHRQSKGVI